MKRIFMIFLLIGCSTPSGRHPASTLSADQVSREWEVMKNVDVEFAQTTRLDQVENHGKGRIFSKEFKCKDFWFIKLEYSDEKNTLMAINTPFLPKQVKVKDVSPSENLGYTEFVAPGGSVIRATKHHIARNTSATTTTAPSAREMIDCKILKDIPVQLNHQQKGPAPASPVET